MSLRKRFQIFLAVFWLVVLGWQFASMQAWGFDDSVLISDDLVEVRSTAEAIVFRPATSEPVALIFYPGALVDPEAYAPMARAIAEDGFEVAIIKVPLRIAVLESQLEEVRRRTMSYRGESGAQILVLGGHSKGGAMAAQFIGEWSDLFDGLLLVGTSHPRETDLSYLGIDVTKIHGSEDGLASEDEIRQFAPNLPPGTDYVRIDGGNHAQFGWYGSQLGDGTARISRQQQQDLLVEAVLGQLRRVSKSEEGSDRDGSAFGPVPE